MRIFVNTDFKHLKDVTLMPNIISCSIVNSLYEY